MSSQPTRRIGFGELVRTFAYIGLNSFGGPAGQIAVMHDVLVVKKRWIGEHRFVHALNYCMLLPGPEATQLATYVGWLLGRTRGGLAAGLLFVLPGAAAILGLAWVYTEFGSVTAVAGVLTGLQAAVLALILQAVARLGGRVLGSPMLVAIAVVGLVVSLTGAVGFPVLILSAAALGIVGGWVMPGAFVAGRDEEVEGDESILGDEVPMHARANLARTVRSAVVWLVLWLGPVGVLWAALGGGHLLTREAVVFSKAATVTFGGGYAVLTYISEQFVHRGGWIGAHDMVAGLGLGETTPGPLILVLEFVAYVSGFRNPELVLGSGARGAEGWARWVSGAAAAGVCLWTTFVPCFLWVFVGGPYMEVVRGQRELRAALGAISAAVVGVIANLGVWMLLRTLFAAQREVGIGRGMRVTVPVWGTAQWGSIVLAGFACVAVFGLKWNIGRTLAACAVMGCVWYLVRA